MDFSFAEGQIDGISQVLLDMKLVCVPADHHPTVGEQQQVIENGIRANPKVLYSADSALVIAALLRRNYPCQQKQLPR